MCSPDDTKRMKSSELDDNWDWVALKEIYSGCILDDNTTLNIPVSLRDTIAIRINRDEEAKGKGWPPLQAEDTKEDAKYDINPKFQYCVLSKIPDTPIIEVSFYYTSEDGPPTSLDISLLQYPKLWPGSDRNQWTDWLSKEAHNVLEETYSSYSVCDFIEHESMKYFTFVDEGATHGYSAILFSNFSMHTDEQWQNDEEKNSNKDGMIYPVYDIREKRKVQAKSTSDIIHKYARRVLKRNWKKWYTYECPICFCEETASEGVELDCRHFYCQDCIKMYIKTTVSDIHLHRTNAFTCPLPSCKKDMKVMDESQKNLLTEEQKDRLILWEKDIKTPQSRTLTICPRSKCQSRSMRRVDNSSTNTLIFCEDCNTTFCEICMKRVYKSQILQGPPHASECDERGMIKFCRKYSRASDEIKQQCHEKWHWIEEYIAGREMDLSAKLWLRENGMPCPNCKTGIERSDGCFHMHCSVCGTHFCYECGEEIFAPFYGTHHCWEEEQEIQEDMHLGNIFIFH